MWFGNVYQKLARSLKFGEKQTLHITIKSMHVKRAHVIEFWGKCHKCTQHHVSIQGRVHHYFVGFCIMHVTADLFYRWTVTPESSPVQSGSHWINSKDTLPRVSVCTDLSQHQINTYRHKRYQIHTQYSDW